MDGTVSIVQPLIQPMYGGKSAHEIVATLLGSPGALGYDLVREYLDGSSRRRMLQRRRVPQVPRVRQVRRCASHGRRASSPVQPPVTAHGPHQPRAARPTAAADSRTTGRGDVRKELAALVARRIHRRHRVRAHPRHLSHHAPRTRRTAPAPAAPAAPAHPFPAFELNFRRDPTIYDGRFANNGWLQELPKPVTKLTWDNAALISPATRRAARPRERRHHSRSRTKAASCACRSGSIPARRRRHHDSRWLRAHPRRPRRQRHRLQRLRAARQQRRRGLAPPRSPRPATTTISSARRTTGPSKAATSCARLRSRSSRRSRRSRKRWST